LLADFGISTNESFGVSYSHLEILLQFSGMPMLNLLALEPVNNEQTCKTFHYSCATELAKSDGY
jgi:hypothetical protein